MFYNKVFMITGGTGSFGNTMLKRFLSTGVREIRIFSRDEKKQEEMRLALNNSKLRFYIGDVREYASCHEAMKEVDYVFHAAALKQVPSCEFYPMEAVRTNVLGTENVMNAATANGVKRLVVLSTNRAVYPINAMGISKAMAEKLMVAKSRTQLPGETVLHLAQHPAPRRRAGHPVAAQTRLHPAGTGVRSGHAVRPRHRCAIAAWCARMVYRKQITIVPDGDPVIDRSLDPARLQAATGYVAPDWEQLIRAMRAFQ